jgi:pimeloyl-ACP methyl ester carboxylesterase
MWSLVRRLCRLVLLVPLLGAPASAELIPAGLDERTFTVKGEPLDTYTYRPECKDPSLLIVFHGQDRSASDYRDYATELADRTCMIVVAPLFDADRFPTWRYQQGGLERHNVVQPQAEWTGSYVLGLVEEVRRAEGRRMPYTLLGHSAGAQFLMRFAATQANDAARIIIANPGTLVWADSTKRVPYGLDGLPPDRGDEALRRYLAQPLTLVLGDRDTKQDTLSEAPDAQLQGGTRYERGVTVFRAAEAKARELSLPFNWSLVEVSGVGHSARKIFSALETLKALRP